MSELTAKEQSSQNSKPTSGEIPRVGFYIFGKDTIPTGQLFFKNLDQGGDTDGIKDV